MLFSPYSVIRFAHIATGGILIANSLAAPYIRRTMQRATTDAELAAWVALMRRCGRLNAIAALVLLATGIHFGLDGWWRAEWFAVASAAWLLNIALVVVVLKPATEVLASGAAGKSGAVDAGLDRSRKAKLHVAEELVLGCNLATLYLMVDKPGLAGSVAICLGTVGGLVAGGSVRRWWRRVQDASRAGGVDQ